MRLKQLTLRDFGPFRNYSISLDLPEAACLLLTGKNNEGKSHILFALRLLDAGLKVAGKKRHQVDLDGAV
ncbi:MAG: ATP-binding protein [Gemmatimonadetes bacterium]|nr:ATP-binding protein [Gemmatimonadota bacterium]